MRKNDKQLFVDGDRIVDESGVVVPTEEARRRWEAGEIKDWNLAFQRLAQYDFDFARLKAYYARTK